MNLPSDLQRFLPYIAVAVLAVAGLMLVTRGVGSSEDGGAAPPSQIDRGGEVRGPGDAGAARGNGPKRDGSARAGERAPGRRSAKAYVACVEQATDTAALEKCQALLP